MKRYVSEALHHAITPKSIASLLRDILGCFMNRQPRQASMKNKHVANPTTERRKPRQVWALVCAKQKVPLAKSAESPPDKYI